MEIKICDVFSDCLNNINLEFKEKSITALIGSDNSCKTNLINLINGQQKINKGYIKYGRKKIDSLSNDTKINSISEEVFYVSSDYREYLFNINIKEDFIYYVGNKEEDSLIDILKTFNLDKDILNKSYLDLSSIEYKKIIMILAIMSNSKIIIIEDPTLNLDYKTTEILTRQLKKLKREGKIVIITSNNMDFVLGASDVIVALNEYSVIDKGDKYKILSNEKVLESVNAEMPNLIKFVNAVRKDKKIKLSYKDNMSDLIKEVYRHAK